MYTKHPELVRLFLRDRNKIGGLPETWGRGECVV